MKDGRQYYLALIRAGVRIADLRLGLWHILHLFDANRKYTVNLPCGWLCEVSLANDVSIFDPGQEWATRNAFTTLAEMAVRKGYEKELADAVEKVNSIVEEIYKNAERVLWKYVGGHEGDTRWLISAAEGIELAENLLGAEWDADYYEPRGIECHPEFGPLKRSVTKIVRNAINRLESLTKHAIKPSVTASRRNATVAVAGHRLVVDYDDGTFEVHHTAPWVPSVTSALLDLWYRPNVIRDILEAMFACISEIERRKNARAEQR